PGKIPENSIARDLVDLSDFLPTMADLAGVKIPVDWGKIDGVSFKNRLLQGEPTPRKWAYVETKGTRFTRTADFKLYGNGRFFDMQADPEEKNPIKTDPAGEALKAKILLQKALDSVPSSK
ncbi:MAG: arylsulfatase A, partial [Verrucomicrobiales bacterium]|nr:arylsulfatase A [Verrucomicrobiales bacterium]